MRKVNRILLLFATVGLAVFGVGPSHGAPPAVEPPVREIFVPLADLEVLLESQPQRVLLTRREYEQLLKKAKTTPETHAPKAALVVSADYTVAVLDGRAQWTGKLALEILEPGLHAVPLDLSGVGLQSALLDGKPAAVGQLGKSPLVLFVEGVGRHELVLRMISPLETTAAQQILRFHVPRPSASRLRLTVPGDVEAKDGASVVSREVDAAAEETRFELLPPVGDAALVMTLNSRLQRRNRVVTARSVLVDEVTQAYERLHATISLGVLHGAVDGFRFAVPTGFEVTDVNSPLVARWAVAKGDGPSGQVLDVRLREPSTETIVLNVSAIKTPPQLDEWRLPKLEPLDVVSHASVLGVLAEDRLRAESIASEMLIPIDTADLLRALPETVFQAEPGAAPLKPVVAYYAPGGEFSLAARFDLPPAATSLVTNVLLIVAERSLEARGQFVLTPEVEELFGFDFTVPEGWHVTSVTTADAKPLEFEAYDDQGQARIRVRIAEGIPPGQSCAVSFTAENTPDGWLGEWQSRQLEFPVFAVSGATRDVGAIAVQARDDLRVRPGEPETIKLLTPLDDAEKQQYGLTGVEASLVYRYEGAGYSAGLVADRTDPRLTARTYSFLRISPEGLAAHYEVAYQVEQARTAKLSFLLPEATPETLSIRGLDGVGLKEFSSEPAGDDAAGQRRWNVLLAGPRRGQIRLAVDFQQPLPSQEPKDFALPLVRADAVAYQSGLLAIEGNPELDVQVDAEARSVDVGELVDAEYQPGRGLLGVFGFVGDPPAATVDVFRHPGYPLDPAIVQRAELATQISAEGVSQTAARFELRVKVPYLTVTLPHGSRLWSADLDGRPIKPQAKGESLLVSVPAGDAGAIRTLRVVYEDTSVAVSLAGKVDVRSPKLYLPGEEEGSLAEVPVADMVWRLYLPAGYEATASEGTLVTQLDRPEPAVFEVAKALAGLLFFSPALHVQAAREAASGSAVRNELRQLGIAVHSLHDSGATSEQTQPGHYYMDSDVEYSAPSLEREPPAAADRPSVAAGVELGGLAAADEMPQSEPAAAAPPPPPAQPAAGMPPKPQTAQPTPQRTPEPPAPALRRLKGLNSLKIELADGAQADQTVVVFHSLGVDPQLQVSLANGPRFGVLGWALALAVVLVGLVMSSQSVSVQTRLWLILSVMVLGTLVPLIPGLEETAAAANTAVYAAAILVPYYLLLGCVRWFAALFRSKRAAPAATAAAMLVAAALLPASGAAAPPAKTGPYVIQVVEPDAPVTVPDDAVILPYDPEAPDGATAADQILVPYAKYVELWNRAYPDEKLTATPAPAPYALAGASYSTTLEGQDYLLVEGQLDVDVFADKQVAVPLGLGGGVLSKAELDGKPARISVPKVEAPQNQSQQQAARPAQVPQPSTLSPQLILLHVDGKGRHKLSLSVRLRLERRGGWRVAEGVLPTAPAASVEIAVLKPQTELRLANSLDRRSFETEKADEKIETVLAPGGAIGIQWRPRVAEAQVDRSLTSQSSAVLDVQEDGLRLVWELSLEFPRAQRDGFDVHVPHGYLVKRVEGANVRGWEVRPSEDSQTVSISLLNTARDQERLTLHLWRDVQVGQEGSSEFDAPVVTVADAALAAGRLTIRRSPLLDLRSVSTAGVTRTDLPAQSNAAESESEESPLGLRPFQAYVFAATPFSIRLTASPVKADVSADVQSVLRIAEYERSLESRIKLDVGGRPIYRVEILLPENLELPLESVSAPGDHQWAVTERDGRQLLTVYLAAGQQGQVPLVLRGKLAHQEATTPLTLPSLEVLGAARQQGDIAVQVDPAFDVRTADLANCRTVHLDRVFAWLDADQKQATRLALHTSGGGYSGTLLVSLRQPRVSCDTITNVRVTDRAVEETILLDFTISSAGIRELSFLLPASMENCRVNVPMLREKTDEPAGDEPDSPRRIRLQLQDDVIDSLRVLVEHDRPLSAEPPPAPIPVLETEGRPGEWAVGRQFVALENAGRDELVVRETEGLAPLNRQQKEWQTLRAMLGGNITQAYLARDREEPSLRYALEERKAVEMTGARIRFAESDLVVDPSGAYRCRQIYRLDNTTEQFLEIKLPDAARLWTAQVAGDAVKPTVVPDATEPGLVRIPLVKTAEGDLDFAVVLKYGGKMPPVGTVAEVGFPLIKARGINVELSQVRLHLPPTHRWFDFGGTMTPVQEEADLAAGYLSYQTKVAERLMKTAQHAGEFAQVRAASNLKSLKETLESSSYDAWGESGYENERLQQEFAKNAAVLRDAEQQIDRLERADTDLDDYDNRDRLNQLYTRQRVNRARNVVQGLGYNFPATVTETKPSEAAGSARFNADWLDKSKLSNKETAAPADDAKKRLIAAGGKPAKAPQQKGEAAQSQFRGYVFQQDGMGLEDQTALFGSQTRTAGEDSESNRPSDRRDAIARYEKQLQEQQAGQGGGAGFGGALRGREGDRFGDGMAAGEMLSEREETHQAFGRVVRGAAVANGQVAQQVDGVFSADLDIPFVPESQGLASLDVELPERGVVYRFRMPGGDVAITARAASNRLIDGLTLAAVVLGALLVVLWIVRLAAVGRFEWATGRVAGVVFICLGLALLVFLPMSGLLLLAAGIITLVRRTVIRREAASPFAEGQPAEAS